MMGNTYIDLIFITLVALAVTFMLWVLWNFHKAARKP
jgi:high-affinity Fe2+/Pb2+ permease